MRSVKRPSDIVYRALEHCLHNFTRAGTFGKTYHGQPVSAAAHMIEQSGDGRAVIMHQHDAALRPVLGEFVYPLKRFDMNAAVGKAVGDGGPAAQVAIDED